MTPIKMHPCTSSQIAKFGYDPESSTMRIEFSRGGLYDYRAVPATVFQDFVAASSKGSFHYHNIRTKFAYDKLG